MKGNFDKEKNIYCSKTTLSEHAQFVGEHEDF